MENAKDAAVSVGTAHLINQSKDGLSDELESLLNWMGPQLETSFLVPHIFPETGRGLKATRDIEAGTRLILVGSRYCFTARTARLFRPEIPSHLLKKPLECLTMFLMLEDQLGVHSSVAPYVHSLPRTFTNPLSLFEGTRFRIPDGVCSELDALLRKQRDEMILGWKSVSAAFRDFDEKTRTASCTPKNFCWAWFAVATRTLYVNPKEPALVPFLDLFNHSPIAKVETRWNERDDGFEIITDCPYRAGEQVFINYGSHDNMKLAVYYGFIVPENALSEVKFNLDGIMKKLPVSAAQEDFLKSYGAWRPLSCSWNGFCDTSKLFLRARLCHGKDLWKTVDNENLPDCDKTRMALMEILCDKSREMSEYANNVASWPLLRSVYSESINILAKNLTIL